MKTIINTMIGIILGIGVVLLVVSYRQTQNEMREDWRNYEVSFSLTDGFTTEFVPDQHEFNKEWSDNFNKALSFENGADWWN